MTCYSRAWCLAVASILIALPTLALCQQADTEAIATIIKQQGDAWNRGDAEAFAAHYASDGSFTNVLGQQIIGKVGFVAQHERIFGSIYKGSHSTFTLGHLQFVRPDVAVADIDGVLTGARSLPGGLKPSEDGGLHVKLQEVMSKENGDWVIRAFHNVAVVALAAGPPQAGPAQTAGSTH